MADKDISWVRGAKTPLFSTRIFSVSEEEASGPGGRRGRFVVMDAPDWAMVVPLLRGPDRLLMVRQFRHGEGALSAEFPGGVIEPGEDPRAGALRELEEETGYRAGEMASLGSVNPNPAYQRNKLHLFAATGLERISAQSLDPDEVVDVEFADPAALRAGLGKPPYVHALMIVAYCLWERWADKEGLLGR